MLSSLWGVLSGNNIITRNEEQVESQNLSIGGSDKADYQILDYIDNEETPYYKLLDTKNPYKHNIRLKPFITSYARLIVASVALDNVDSVIRIRTDNITYNKPIEHNIPNLIPEGKTTGKIDWKHTNKYNKI